MENRSIRTNPVVDIRHFRQLLQHWILPHVLRLDQDPIRQISGIPRRVSVSEEQLAASRLEAVSCDNEIGVDRLARGKRRRRERKIEACDERVENDYGNEAGALACVYMDRDKKKRFKGRR